MSGGSSRSTPLLRKLYAGFVLFVASIGCSDDSSSPPVAEQASDGSDAVIARIVALDPRDEAAQAELASIATGPEAPSVRLLALRRLEAGEAPALEATAASILSEPESPDADARQLYANAAAALVRLGTPSARAALDAQVAAAGEERRAVLVAVAGEASR